MADHDSPAQRDAKAAALVIERDELAALLAAERVALAAQVAKELRRFRTEAFALYGITVVLVLISLIAK